MGDSQGAGKPGPANGVAALAQNAGQPPRPFTLQEALPYSPQTSVIPFTSEFIPDPTIGSGLPASSIAPLFNQNGDFEAINKHATAQDAPNKQFKHAVEQVLQELRPNQRPFYKFKSITKPMLDPTAKTDKSGSLLSGVSPLTKAVLDKAPTFIKQTSAADAGQTPNVANGRSSATPRPSSSRKHQSPIEIKHTKANVEAHQQNAAKFEIAIPAKSFDPSQYAEVVDKAVDVPAVVKKPSTPPSPSLEPPSSQSRFAVELQPTTLKKEEYLEVPDELDEPTNLSARKRKRGGYDDSQDPLGASLDRRQRADAALHDLGRLTKDVFDTVGRALQNEAGLSHVVTLTGDREPMLSGGCHQKLQAALLKVIDLGAFADVPIDVLVRVQRLADVGIKSARELDLKVEESWSESEVQTWLDQLPDIETGLKAARTTLRVMSGGREEKQIYSEETIQQSIDLFKSVVDNLVIPIVELRGSGPSSNLFKLLHPHKKAIASVLTTCQRVFSLFATIVQGVQLSDMAIGSLEFSASSLIFVDNAYYEKDSVVGIQKFDGIRLVAMDMLCQIFVVKPDQRNGIFSDLLTSLEKLPVGKQSARQFRLSEGGNIQPLSALIMRLVQASTGKVEPHVARSLLNEDPDNDEDELQGSTTKKTAVTMTIKSEEEGAQQNDTAMQELEDTVKPLAEDARRNSIYVVNFLVNRALKSTKSGDTPYRNLLDLFVEDFTTCMDSPDWPAAELVLRQLTFSMLRIWEDGKSAAPAKNMALELLGVMGAAISKLRSHVRKMADSRDGSSSDELSRYLSELALSALEQKNKPEHLVSWSGPFRATLEYLEERCADDPYLRGAISYLIADWSLRTCAAYHAFEEDVDERDRELGALAYRLRMMVDDRRWLSNEYTFKTVSTSHAKLSYSIVLLRSPFAEHFSAMLNVLLSAMASDQATVRSKSLKSINQLLETDPAILDGDSVVVQLILNCSNDSSPQVRDSAVGLMGKCIQLRNNLEARMTEKILDRFIDSGVGVRKRAMKLARDIYLRNKDKETRSVIANGLLHRVQDPDEGVRDLARQMIEEVWFAPFYHADDTPAFTTALTDHVALMIQTVKAGNIAAILDKVLQAILSSPNKSQHGPFGVSLKLVEKMFELIDNLDSDDPSVPPGRDALQVLQIFAKADAKLFTFEETRLLKAHLGSFNNPDDLTVFKAVTAIYRQVLPQLTAKHSDFLKEIREQLQKSIGKLSKHLLDDVVACLWIIAGLLDMRTPLARLGGSSLAGTAKLRQATLSEKHVRTFARYAEIVGMVGKHCDLDSELDDFKGTVFANWKGTSVTKLMVDQLSLWADKDKPPEARRAALDAIGLICQAHPRNYVSPNVYPKFEQVFSEKNQALEAAVLRSFKEFLLAEERRSEAAAANEAEGGGDQKRNLTVMGGTSYDDVASATTQRFLKEITRIALSTLDEHAFLAVEVLGSINRQGLVHPKETGTTLITLETSPVTRISEVAFMEHRSLHAKYETVIEREYAKSIQSAFNYQRDVVKDTHGAVTNPFQSKLHLLMETLKISKSKNRQKFLTKLVAMVDFDPTKLDATLTMPPHVEYSRFIIENMAYFEYVTIGEVTTIVNAMEKFVSSTGSSLAHIIETEIFNVRMDIDRPAHQPPQGATDGVQDDGQPSGDVNPSQPADPALNIEPKRLRQLSAGAIILLIVWEARTHLRRLYGLGNSRRDPKAKGSSKDMSKAPVKVPGFTGDKFWEEVASHIEGLSSQASLLHQCRLFVELMNVDKEFKVPDEQDDEMNGGGPTTPNSAGEEDEAAGDGRGRKRKATSNTPGSRKKRARSSSRAAKGRSRPKKNASPDDDDADGDFDLEGPSDWL